MFHFQRRKSQPKQKPTSNQLFKRSLALAAGLLLLWLALSVMPKQSSATQPLVYSDDAGTVATSTLAATPASSEPFAWGKISAGILLAGLIGFAVYWQKKNNTGQLSQHTLHSLGKIQLSPNQHVHLIGCGPDALLVGSGNNQITLLHQIPLQKLQEPASDNVIEVLKTPKYSTPTSTHINNMDFGFLLSQQNLQNQPNLLVQNSASSQQILSSQTPQDATANG